MNTVASLTDYLLWLHGSLVKFLCATFTQLVASALLRCYGSPHLRASSVEAKAGVYHGQVVVHGAGDGNLSDGTDLHLLVQVSNPNGSCTLHGTVPHRDQPGETDKAPVYC